MEPKTNETLSSISIYNKVGREIGAAAKNEADFRAKVEEALKSGKLILNQDKDKRIPTELQKGG